MQTVGISIPDYYPREEAPSRRGPSIRGKQGLGDAVKSLDVPPQGGGKRKTKTNGAGDRLYERLRAQLAEAIDDIASWAAYADDYFLQKWDLDGCLERHKKALTPNV